MNKIALILFASLALAACSAEPVQVPVEPPTVETEVTEPKPNCGSLREYEANSACHPV